MLISGPSAYCIRFSEILSCGINHNVHPINILFIIYCIFTIIIYSYGSTFNKNSLIVLIICIFTLSLSIIISLCFMNFRNNTRWCFIPGWIMFSIFCIIYIVCKVIYFSSILNDDACIYDDDDSDEEWCKQIDVLFDIVRAINIFEWTFYGIFLIWFFLSLSLACCKWF